MPHCEMDSSYGKSVPGAKSHFEFCCSFPQNTHTLHAPESSIFIGFLCRFSFYLILILLPLKAKIWEQRVSQKVRILILFLAKIQNEKNYIIYFNLLIIRGYKKCNIS